MLHKSPHLSITVIFPRCSDPVQDVRPLDIKCHAWNSSGNVPSAKEWAVHNYDNLSAPRGRTPPRQAV